MNDTITREPTAQDVNVYAGTGYHSLNFMEDLYVPKQKFALFGPRWKLLTPHRYWKHGRDNYNKAVSLIAHRCNWWGAPWGEWSRRYAYIHLIYIGGPEHCWRCREAIPTSLIGLWIMHNWKIRE